MLNRFLILLLLTVAAILAIYLITWVAWRRIDLISAQAEKFVRNRYYPDFDADKFRQYVNSLLLPGDYRVIFHLPFFEYGRNPNALNARTGLPGQRVVIFAPGWVARMYREAENGRERAVMGELFAFALGHELTHREQPLRSIFLFGRKERCAGRIREIHADLGGMRKAGMSAGRLSECVRAVYLREDRKRREEKSRGGRAGMAFFGDGDGICAGVRTQGNANGICADEKARGDDICTGRNAGRGNICIGHAGRHPSWEYRMMCWEIGQMDPIIDMVCRDCGVSSRRFRDHMKALYAA